MQLRELLDNVKNNEYIELYELDICQREPYRCGMWKAKHVPQKYMGYKIAYITPCEIGKQEKYNTVGYDLLILTVALIDMGGGQYE